MDEQRNAAYQMQQFQGGAGPDAGAAAGVAMEPHERYNMIPEHVHNQEGAPSSQEPHEMIMVVPPPPPHPSSAATAPIPPAAASLPAEMEGDVAVQIYEGEDDGIDPQIHQHAGGNELRGEARWKSFSKHSNNANISKVTNAQGDIEEDDRKIAAVEGNRATAANPRQQEQHVVQQHRQHQQDLQYLETGEENHFAEEIPAEASADPEGHCAEAAGGEGVARIPIQQIPIPHRNSRSSSNHRLTSLRRGSDEVSRVSFDDSYFSAGDSTIEEMMVHRQLPEDEANWYFRNGFNP
eukprot:CAMPEP_0198124028 /NCGR_PEP_ID=MMETSP1442-20131203/38928_1 /TAXON_ID= /ORGANISM="Craspedostauros australis, Strain CCMP3328" /LENGTH=293 /DNA_ID=CAMNT_0043783345 /DNA_START=6 /DNA_END=887 /DNA_ORIENTATION=+